MSKNIIYVLGATATSFAPSLVLRVNLQQLVASIICQNCGRWFIDAHNGRLCQHMAIEHNFGGQGMKLETGPSLAVETPPLPPELEEAWPA